MSWDAPKVNLFDICNPKQWRTIPKSQLLEHGYPVYGANGQIGYYSEYNHEKPTVLITCRGATCGTLNMSKPFSYVTGNAMALDGLDERRTASKFVCYALMHRGLADVISGSAQPQITRTNLQKVYLPIPPLVEQKRIVAKVEQLLARVNAARGRLAKVPAILKRFRQSVLAAACSGRLTAEWREKHPGVRSVKEVLHRIQWTRLEQAITPAQKKKHQDIYSYQEREDSKLLPETWEYVALDKLCESFQYGTSKKSQPSGEIPVLRMGNIQNGEIVWSDLVYTSDSTEIQKYELDPGDVLFNRTNSPELVGKTAIYRGKQPAIFAGYLIKINNLEELDSRYLNCCLNSTYGREFCLKAKTDGVSQSNINAQKLGKFEVPFCCEEEQQEIVRRVEALFRLADTIEKRVAAATAQAGKLTQAILARAFRGELVPTEAELARREGRSYEPASALLAKIEAQRKAVKPQRKHTGSKRQRSK